MMNWHQGYRILPRIQARLVTPTRRAVTLAKAEAFAKRSDKTKITEKSDERVFEREQTTEAGVFTRG
jgi:hypothetical protein